MSLAPHFVENMYFVSEFTAQCNFRKLNRGLMLALTGGWSKPPIKHQGPCSLQNSIISNAKGPIPVMSHGRSGCLDISLGLWSILFLI
jgi:hypothetical protein